MKRRMHPACRWHFLAMQLGYVLWLASLLFAALATNAAEKPNIILLMADDQGYGDVAYNGNPHVKTPVLDEMAEKCLRLDRYYTAAPVCSPTRGSVMTGRHPNRYGCFSWGRSLRPEEVTLAEVLQTAGYATGHFGKWHLGSLAEGSPVSPAKSGFDEWFSSPNFFENSPFMCHNGKVVKTEGEGSRVIVDAALQFIRQAANNQKPFFAVVWFGSPHGPHVAFEKDKSPYAGHPEAMQNYWGEITAMDRAIGHLRTELRSLAIADNTLLWYSSDNGATTPGSTGGFRGRKGTLYDGGLRVPAIVEWPGVIKNRRRSDLACGSVDIYPTILEIVSARADPQPALDGISIAPLIRGSNLEFRNKPMGFWVHPAGGVGVNSHQILERMEQDQAAGRTTPVEIDERPVYSESEFPGHAAWLDGAWKLHRIARASGNVQYELYDLGADPLEATDLAGKQPARLAKMQTQLAEWQTSVVRSLNGKDYPSTSK